MTEIVFIHDAPDRLAAAHVWLRQAWQRRERVLVHVPAPDAAERLDRLLWTQPQLSFVPHCAIDHPLAAETPILFTRGLEQLPHEDCLLNLSNDLPTVFSRFSRLVEIVSRDDAVRLPARERYRFYRERGYPIQLISFDRLPA